MFADLNWLLDMSDKKPPFALFALLTDYNTDGSFLLQHFLSLSLRANCRTCLVATEQSFSHFSAIAQKLGLNLGSCVEDGRLVFIDAFSALLDDVVGLTSSSGSTWPTFTLDKTSMSLRGLFDLVRAAAPDGGRPFSVLVDNCSLLLSAGVALHEVNSFVQNCQVLTCGPSPGFLVARVRDNFDEADDCSDERSLVALLTHRCQLLLKVRFAHFTFFLVILQNEE